MLSILLAKPSWYHHKSSEPVVARLVIKLPPSADPKIPRCIETQTPQKYNSIKPHTRPVLCSVFGQHKRQTETPAGGGGDALSRPR